MIGALALLGAYLVFIGLVLIAYQLSQIAKAIRDSKGR